MFCFFEGGRLTKNRDPSKVKGPHCVSLGTRVMAVWHCLPEPGRKTGLFSWKVPKGQRFLEVASTWLDLKGLEFNGPGWVRPLRWFCAPSVRGQTRGDVWNSPSRNKKTAEQVGSLCAAVAQLRMYEPMVCVPQAASLNQLEAV